MTESLARHEQQAPTNVREHLVLLSRISRELGATDSLRDAMARALTVLRGIGVERAAVFFFDADTPTLRCEATFGVGPEHFRSPGSRGIVGRVAESGKPIVVPRVAHDAAALRDLSHPPAWQEPVWSELCVPLVLRERCVGALAVFMRQGTRADFRGLLSALNMSAPLFAQAQRVLRQDASPEVQHKAAASPRSAVFEYSNMVGSSVAMRQVYEQIGQVAGTTATVLLRGESGSGKELVANAIHQNSPRATQPFVKLNCAAMPDHLVEAELFGYERGAFTGATARKKGRFELADGGTLFLDEVAELSAFTQAKLLRALQFREFERLGGTETVQVDVRLIAATNQDIEALVQAGRFRADLYYRINVFSITIPPLRDRRADIPSLANYFVAKYAKQHGRRVSTVSSGALELLAAYSWPGNVRELENAIERAVVVCTGNVLSEADLPDISRRQPAAPERQTLAEAVRALERRMIEDALRTHGNNASRAARALGTSERILRYKARKLGLGLGRSQRTSRAASPEGDPEA